MPNVCKLLDIAKAELANLLPEEVLLVRDLFKGYELNRISHRNRLLLGTLLLNYIKTDDIQIVLIRKTYQGNSDIKNAL